MNKLCVLFLMGVFAWELNSYSALGQILQPKSNLKPTTSTIASTSTAPTTLAPGVRQCIRDCPVTPEYNPVCGTNNVTYPNPSHVACAQWCGVDVSIKRTGRCPSTE